MNRFFRQGRPSQRHGRTVYCRVAAACLLAALAGAQTWAQQPKPVLDVQFDGAVAAQDAAGRAVAPLVAEGLVFAPADMAGAMRADAGRLAFPASIVPDDAGSLELWVSPLEAATGEGWHIFTGDPDQWGAVGCPRLWIWNGQPRFDVDGGDRYICSGMPDWLTWKPGTWHQFVGTWDRSGDVQLYLDGRLLAERNTAPWEPEARQSFLIGAGHAYEGDSLLRGNVLIDSVRVYDRVLPEHVIRAHARERGLCPPLETLVRPHPNWRNALTPKGAPGPELTLATTGNTDYAILLPEKPTTQEEKAAADLVLWLDAMTHVAFPVLCEGGGESPAKAISVGRTARLTAAGLPEAAADLGGEGYGIA
ncbi:MAG: LamG domain-containing protein, partial [Candidatus Hydrogenedentes bacterium]|nr:LamG domain-containing protein [Candidatus Hydrogenedentota bacterium]